MGQIIQWKAFVEGLPAENRLSGLLIQPWTPRSAEGAAAATLAARAVAPEELTQRLARGRDLLTAAAPHLGWLTAMLGGIPHVVFLTDADGVVLHSCGNDTRRMADFSLFPGFDWSEAALGPNGAGTAIRHNRPVTVLGPDHAATPLEDCTCTGAPLHAPDGTVIGAIAVNASVEDGTPERLVLVAHTAFVIDRELMHSRSARSGQVQALAHATVRALAEAPTLSEGLVGVLDAVCTGLDVSFGVVWQVDATAGVLRARELRHRPGAAADGFQALACATREVAYASGEGLPGRAWTLGAPAWLDDAERDFGARAAAARAAGVAGGLAVPIRGRTGVLGVVELLDGDTLTDQPEAVAAMNAVADQLVLFLGREAARYALARSEAALRDADVRKNEFLGMLAHELRNPLAPIRNAIHLLGAADSGEDIAQKASAVAERQFAHIARLVDDLLDVSRINQGKIRLHRERLDLAEVAGSAAEAAQPALLEKRQAFRLALPGHALWVDGDRTRLEQIISNLLGNASKFTPDGGHVTLSLVQQGDKALLSVEDDGAGIASEALPHVFDLFFQAETSLDRPQGGLGIGLTLARRLVEVHGGTIQVASAGRGQGSRFAFQLPLLDGGCDAVTPESDTAQPAVAPLRVLLVEDNADAAETTAMMISLWGHEVALARDGDDALRQAATFSADVILLDIGLPKMDGYELAERLRQRLAGPPPWLVALSGYGAAERSDAGRESIFDCHLVKPVAPAALEALLADYAASRPAKGSRAPARGASSEPP